MYAFTRNDNLAAAQVRRLDALSYINPPFSPTNNNLAEYRLQWFLSESTINNVQLNLDYNIIDRDTSPVVYGNSPNPAVTTEIYLYLWYTVHKICFSIHELIENTIYASIICAHFNRTLAQTSTSSFYFLLNEILYFTRLKVWIINIAIPIILL